MLRKAIKHIKERERALLRLQRAFSAISRGETDPETQVRRAVCSHMLNLRACSVFVVEAVVKWQRACGPKTRQFIWANHDYLHKMLHDTDFAETYAYITETLCVQGPFFLSFDKLRKRDETKHAMLVRSDYDVVNQEEIVNSPPGPDQQRMFAALDYLRGRNERVKFKSVDTNYRYFPEGRGAELLTNMSVPNTAASAIHLARSSQQIQESTIDVHSTSHSMHSLADTGVQGREEADVVANQTVDSGLDAAVAKETRDGPAELSFDELDFSLDDGSAAASRLIAPDVACAKIAVGDTTKENSDMYPADVLKNKRPVLRILPTPMSFKRCVNKLIKNLNIIASLRQYFCRVLSVTGARALCILSKTSHSTHVYFGVHTSFH